MNELHRFLWIVGAVAGKYWLLVALICNRSHLPSRPTFSSLEMSVAYFGFFKINSHSGIKPWENLKTYKFQRKVHSKVRNFCHLRYFSGAEFSISWLSTCVDWLVANSFGYVSKLNRGVYSWLGLSKIADCIFLLLVHWIQLDSLVTWRARNCDLWSSPEVMYQKLRLKVVVGSKDERSLWEIAYLWGGANVRATRNVLKFATNGNISGII